ncbi:helix-turn-helix transcriptional regulator [Carnobacterium pleistocenium]|uniref:helix-turn-helix transcriptional regulator n=1 Tax=Carnobacterium pleistocenium TaxID=181073 RepID=UPI00054E65AA|nr:helix-turn-helix transcriptional regulator [Carnobacterium pleistocenium]
MNINLKVARVKKNLTQKDLAKKVGVTNKYLSQIENGVSNNPSNDLMIRLAKELGCSVQELFFEGVNK